MVYTTSLDQEVESIEARLQELQRRINEGCIISEPTLADLCLRIGRVAYRADLATSIKLGASYHALYVHFYNHQTGGATFPLQQTPNTPEYEREIFNKAQLIAALPSGYMLRDMPVAVKGLICRQTFAIPAALADRMTNLDVIKELMVWNGQCWVLFNANRSKRS